VAHYLLVWVAEDALLQNNKSKADNEQGGDSSDGMLVKLGHGHFEFLHYLLMHLS